MSLRRRPHTVTVRAFDQTIAGGSLSVGVPVYDSGTPVPGFLQPMQFGTVLDPAGNAVNRPHALLVDVTDAGAFALNNRVSLGSRVFQVRCLPEIRSASMGADHALVLLEELEVV